jgi:dihydroflavonol-4-reductase
MGSESATKGHLGLAVVTGGSGYVGANLVRALRATGRRVRVVDLRPPAGPADPGTTWVRADVRDRIAMRHALDGADMAYHLAAVISLTGGRRGRVQSVNVEGVRVVAEAAHEAGVRLVHCSSVHAFDLASRIGHPIDETCPAATDRRLPAYDRSKAGGEAALRDVIRRGLDAVVVNPTGIIGPRDDGPSRIGAGIVALWNGRLPAIVDGGFDWIDVRDVVTALLAAHERGRTGESYLVPGHRTSAYELLQIAARVGGVPAPRVLPMWCVRPWAPLATALGTIHDSSFLPTRDALHALITFPHVNGAKAERELGHTPRSLETTLRDLYASYDRPRLARTVDG